MATGGIINSGYTGVSTSPGNGELDIKYSTTADQNHPTQFSVITAAGAGPWQNVHAASSNSPLLLIAQTYQIQFRRTTTTPADTPPPKGTYTVQEDKLLTLKVHYT